MSNECCPEIPDCCDMRGLLSFSVLWLLSKREMNGQEIAKEIEGMKGKKPSPGTIYPALKDLRNKGLVEMKRKGRSTTYKLSVKGVEGLEKACRYFCSAFGDIFEEYNSKIKKKI
jgi:DNA-binding PadR family transcriptional regulator